jgi:sulfate transport system permease protein
MSQGSRRALPGFFPSLSFTVLYVTALVVIPLGACLLKALSLSPVQFWDAVWTERTQAAYLLTFGGSLVAAAANVVIGLLLAWVLVRYRFPLRRFVDSLIDLQLALPTAVAGLVFSSLYAESGWLGRVLTPLGFEVYKTRLGVVLVLIFVGLPFVVRSVQPVLQQFDRELEEAAASLGASRWQVFRKVILPTLYPSLWTGFALAFARAIGEYGAVIFISGNIRLQTEIAPLLIVERLSDLEPGSDARATALAVVLLAVSFAMLVVINVLERRSRRHEC